MELLIQLKGLHQDVDLAEMHLYSRNLLALTGLACRQVDIVDAWQCRGIQVIIKQTLFQRAVDKVLHRQAFTMIVQLAHGLSF